MEQTKARFIAALEFDDDDDKNKQFVRCQSCSLKFRMWKGESNLAPTNQKRVEELKKRISFAQIKNFDCTEYKKELNKLLEERKQTGLLTRLPLYSSKITGYRWVCSTCYDKFYMNNMHVMQDYQL